MSHFIMHIVMKAIYGRDFRYTYNTFKYIKDKTLNTNYTQMQCIQQYKILLFCLVLSLCIQ